MEYLWEFFEEFDELVYVSDMETNEIVYMNAVLRRFMGYLSHEEYKGKKCYQVLQGQDVPCDFCTNSQLEVGKFITWTHKNLAMNKRFLIKDSMVEVRGRSYRVEITIDMDSEVATSNSHYYARGETILNGCLQQLFSTPSPEEAIEKLLTYIGEIFCCDRSYLFEFDDADQMTNSYEWCAEGVVSQKDIFIKEPVKSIEWWLPQFQENQVVVLEDVEQIRAEHPETYAMLKSQNTKNLVVGPIYAGDRLMGFIGVDNPGEGTVHLLTPLLNIIGYFMASLLRRRDLMTRLNNLSFHDFLTGAYNRNAMAEHQIYREKYKTIGVIYCDITGLKQTNDTMGHDAGDRMIRQCYQLIHDTLQTEWIYRAGGDEFVAVCPDCSKIAFEELLQKLKERIQHNKHHIAVGYTWSDQRPISLETMITKADKIMYQDKREYYEKKRIIQGIDRRHPPEPSEDEVTEGQSLFQQFLASTYYDMESLFQSISQQNTASYFYFGDMQKDIYYISDNMRTEFGFESNVVPGLLREWSQRISSPKFQQIYQQELTDMLEKKRTIHDLRYQVHNASGKNLWVRCYGVVKWNKDKTVPLFVSGRLTHQDNDFVVDPITNFPRESSVFSSLNDIERKGEESLVIGFSLNNITEINNTRGRAYADLLLKSIADSLTEKLSDRMTFYRLEGMRCMAVVDTEYANQSEELVQRIHDIIEECYCAAGISIHAPCSFGLMKYPQPSLSAEDFLEHIISLIRVAKYEVNKPYIDYSSASVQRIKQISRMALALNQDIINGMKHFRIMIQPVVSAEGGRIIGGEVLLRWFFEGQDISPAVFIPMLEKGDMINLVGRWVFQQTVRTCVRLVSYVPDFYLTFNVSLRQLSDMPFTDLMRVTLDRYHLDGSHLVAEITESCLDEQPEHLMRFMDACKKMGLRLALDDFGSGYSSLQMLLRYPYDIIKLDRSLLQEISHSEEKLQFIHSIVYACHKFHKKVCMEGVEDEEQNVIILSTGCDMIQGYYYYRPMELQDLYQLLSKQ